jgi:hypothetical protein
VHRACTASGSVRRRRRKVNTTYQRACRLVVPLQLCSTRHPVPNALRRPGRARAPFATPILPPPPLPHTLSRSTTTSPTCRRPLPTLAPTALVKARNLSDPPTNPPPLVPRSTPMESRGPAPPVTASWTTCSCRSTSSPCRQPGFRRRKGSRQDQTGAIVRLHDPPSSPYSRPHILVVHVVGL